MAFLPPYEDMHDLSAMGLGGATGAGSAPHVTNKHYTLVGDGTFFHGEMSTIANAIKQRQDILFVILDNKNTAMTGHQGTPGSETDLMGRPQNPLAHRGDRARRCARTSWPAPTRTTATPTWTCSSGRCSWTARGW